MRSHWTIWALSILTAETTHKHTTVSAQSIHFCLIQQKNYFPTDLGNIWNIPSLIKETKNSLTWFAQVCVCCSSAVFGVRYGPQSNSPVLWGQWPKDLFWIPAAAAQLQTQQPIRNKPRHIYIERETLARHLACFFKCFYGIHTLFWGPSSFLMGHLRRSPAMSLYVWGLAVLSFSETARAWTSCCAAHCRCLLVSLADRGTGSERISQLQRPDPHSRLREKEDLRVEGFRLLSHHMQS